MLALVIYILAMIVCLANSPKSIDNQIKMFVYILASITPVVNIVLSVYIFVQLATKYGEEKK